MSELSGRRAVVTGGAQGLGEGMARALAAAGASVVVADVKDDLGAKVGADLGEGHGFVHLDVTDDEGWAAALTAAVEQLGGLDILVNNAAARLRAPLDDVNPQTFEDHLAVNLTAQYALAREAARGMAERRYGRIIMISSIAARRGHRGAVAYIAAKGGIESLTRALACEFGPYGVTCNAIAPGAFATEINAEVLRSRQAIDAMSQRCPLGHYGEPSEIAGPCVFLASTAASYVNGHVLTVDGGFTIAM